MQAIGGIGMAYSFLMIINTFLQALVYIAVIVVAFKVLQALNVYINKNSL